MRGTLSDFGTRHPSTAELVVEVAVSSVAPDRENASRYAEANITQYWIVLGETEQVEVYRRPVNGVYQERRLYGRGESIETVSVVDRSGTSRGVLFLSLPEPKRKTAGWFAPSGGFQ